MKQKKYIKPNIKVVMLRPMKFLSFSDGEQREDTVHNPDDEVDAGTALSRRNIWGDE